MDDSVANIKCKIKNPQDMFDLAYQNLKSTERLLKDKLKLGGVIDSATLYAIAKSINDSFSTFKTLIFLNEIIISNISADRKFDDSRFRQMKSIMLFREYLENGNDDIYNPLNNRASAMTFIMQRLLQDLLEDILILTLSFIIIL